MSNNWSQTLQDVNERRQKRTAEEWESNRKQMLAVIDEQSAQLEAMLGITQQNIKPTKIKLGKENDGEATAVAVASDWHVEETVDPKNVNGLNTFNLDVAEQRINAFFRNVVKLTDIERSGSKIDRLILILGGDLMTGYIHEELQESNALSPTETILWLQDRVAGGIEMLSKHFDKIEIPCVFGNHGRTTKKPRHATGAANSYEWMLYHVLAKQLGHLADWHISDGYHLLVDLYGKTLRVHHGDGLKYQGGIGGLTIPVEKAISSWNKGIPADLDIFGHWHQAQQNPKWVSNASLIGYNAYSIAIKAPYEEPSQTFFLFDKKRGRRTGTFPIFLD